LQGIFASAGSDGSYSFWDKDKRTRSREAKIAPAGQAITAAVWNPVGDLFAYAKAYDWSKGVEYYDLAKEPTKLYVHWTTEKDLKQQPTAQRR
jgi:mRNA export factor